MLVVAAGALATSPDERFDVHIEVAGEPKTGEFVAVTFIMEAKVDLDETWYPWAPEWISGQRTPWQVEAEAGETIRQTWMFVPTEEGFWRVGLGNSAGGEDSSYICC